MANLTLPFTAQDLAQLPRDVEQAWAGACRDHGVDPGHIGVEVAHDGELRPTWGRNPIPCLERPLVCGTVACALSALALRLADEPFWYAVEGGRVIGWAAVPPTPGWCGHCGGPSDEDVHREAECRVLCAARNGGKASAPCRDRLRMRDVWPFHPARDAYSAALLERRAKSAATGEPDARREGGWARHVAARGAGR